MKEHQLYLNDTITTEASNVDKQTVKIYVKENQGFIEATNINGITRLIDIATLTTRDFAVVLLKTKQYSFSRYANREQHIKSFEDLQEVLSLCNSINQIKIEKIMPILKYLDDNHLFEFVIGATMYKNNYEGEQLSFDDVITNFINCKEKRLSENRAKINPLNNKKEEEFV